MTVFCVGIRRNDGHYARAKRVSGLGRWYEILSLEKFNVAEAETVSTVEGNMCGAVMQGADAPSWSKTPSRTKGTGRNLRDLVSDRATLGLSGPRREGEEP